MDFFVISKENEEKYQNIKNAMKRNKAVSYISDNDVVSFILTKIANQKSTTEPHITILEVAKRTTELNENVKKAKDALDTKNGKLNSLKGRFTKTKSLAIELQKIAIDLLNKVATSETPPQNE